MDLSIRIAPDQLSAVLDLPAGAYVELPMLKQLLSKGEIRTGLHREALVAATHAADQDRSLLLASGEPPTPGFAGGFDPPLDPTALPRPVRTGDRLGVWLPPTPAGPGVAVDGSPIPAPPDPAPFSLGRGLSVLPDNQVVVDRDGELVLDPNGTIRVAIPGLSERERPDVAIQIDAKALEARIALAAGEYVSKPKLHAALTKAGVVSGVIAEIVERVALSDTSARELVVARGSEPVHGVDARVEMLIEERIKAHIADSDRIDFHDLGKAREVAPGTELARLHPLTTGTPGMNVRGKELPARAGRELNLAALVGDGTRVSSADPHLIEAAVAGIYQRTARGKLQVHPLLIIDGDVDLKCGNIDTTLPVMIKGDIKAGFVVKSACDIQVMGVIEDARVSSQGDLMVRGGILPGQSRVKAHGKVVARYISSREVKGRDFEVASSIRSSRILATGNVHAKEIVAGNLIAAGNLVCEMLGSEGEPRTQVQVGINPYEEALFIAARDGQARLTSQMLGLKERCKLIAHKLNARTQDDGDDSLAQGLRQALQDFSAACARLADCEAVIARHAEQLEEINRASAGATVTVKGVAYVGVEVLIGELAKVEVAQPLARPVFRYHEGAVTWA